MLMASLKITVILDQIPSQQHQNQLSSIYGQSQISLATSQNSLKSLASDVVAYHFCQIDNATTCLVPEFVHSLAAQLSQAPQLKPYHQLLSTDHDLRNKLSLVQCVADPDLALISGIIQPLMALKKKGRINANNCIIIIDALSDAEFHRPDYGDTLASFIKKHLEIFPAWLKIVITIRGNMKEVTRNLPFHNIR